MAKIIARWEKGGGVFVETASSKGKFIRSVGPAGYISVAEVAALLGVTRTAVWKWIVNGKIKSRVSGRDYEVPVSGVRAFAQANMLHIGVEQ